MKPHKACRALEKLTVAIVFCGWTLNAQPARHDSDVGEVSTYIGGAFGQLGGHTWVGAASGAYLSPYTLAVVDISYLPLGTDTLAHGRIAAPGSHLYDFNFTVQVPVLTDHRWAPYGLLGMGVLYNSYRSSVLQPDGEIHLVGQRDFRYGFDTGGGVRYYIEENWGVRGECRFTVSTHDFVRLSGGIFYEFQGPWPLLAKGRKHHGGRFH